MREDAAPIGQALDGDEDALRVLYETHVDFVFGRARDALGRRPEALDVVQETFLRALEQPDEPALPSLLARIADEEIARAIARGAEQSTRGVPGPPRLSGPERELVLNWIRRRRETARWGRLWKWAVAAAVVLVLFALWHLHATVGTAVP